MQRWFSLSLLLVASTASAATRLVPVSAPGSLIAESLEGPGPGAIIGPGTAPVIAAIGDVALIVTTTTNSHSVVARRVGPTGVFDPLGISLDPNFPATRIAIASASGGFLVVWSGYPSFLDVRWRLVRLDGSVGELHSVSSDCPDVAAAASGNRFMITRTGYPCTGSGLIVNSEGAPLAEVPLATAARAVIGEPSGFLVAGLFSSEALRFDRDGRRVGDYFELHVHPVFTAVFDGSATIFAWSDGGVTYLGRLPADSRAFQPTDRIDDGFLLGLTAANGRVWLTFGTAAGYRAAAVADGKVSGERVALISVTTTVVQTSQAALAAWFDVARTGVVAAHYPFTSPFPVGAATVAQTAPSVATDGLSHVAVWMAGVGSKTWIEAGTLQANGTPFESSGIRISAEGHFARVPAIGYGSGMFLVVWFDQDGLLGRRMDVSLRFIDPEPFMIVRTGGSQRPAIAFDGSRWLVLYASSTIGAVRVTATGVVEDQIPLSLPPAGNRNAFGATQLVFDGNSFVAVWEESFWIQGKTPLFTWIAFARISSAGVIDKVARLSVTASTGSGQEPNASYWITNLRIAAHATLTLIAWYDLSAAQVARLRGVFFRNKAPAALGRRRAVSSVPSLPPAVDISGIPLSALGSDGMRFYAIGETTPSSPGWNSDRLREAAFVDLAHVDFRTLELEARVEVREVSATPSGPIPVVSRETIGPPYGTTKRLFWLIP